MLVMDLLLGVFIWPPMFHFLCKPHIFFHHYVDPFFHNYLCNMITWFMGWPAGFKLNSPLNSFLGNMFLWSLHVWRGSFCLVTFYSQFCAAHPNHHRLFLPTTHLLGGRLFLSTNFWRHARCIQRLCSLWRHFCRLNASFVSFS